MKPPNCGGPFAAADNPRLDALIGELLRELFFNIGDQQPASLGESIETRRYDVIGLRI